ncbi:MAG: hypothetical protein BAJALOKI1v1_2070001 [Promethearchaeota archaeon]|nr:MAG: hypothetical protein BAJALOKI1v1_2070001 [Candidatus Lokiarchaeota archaeon]
MGREDPVEAVSVSERLRKVLLQLVAVDWNGIQSVVGSGDALISVKAERSWNTGFLILVC